MAKDISNGDWLRKIRKELHYPECWDTLAYPSVWHAIYEIASCNECKPLPTNNTPKEQQVEDSVVTDENWQIAIKNQLLYAAWSARDKGYDNEYAVAYQAVREVFDKKILPYLRTTNDTPTPSDVVERVAIALAKEYGDSEPFHYWERLAKAAIATIGEGKPMEKKELILTLSSLPPEGLRILEPHKYSAIHIKPEIERDKEIARLTAFIKYIDHLPECRENYAKQFPRPECICGLKGIAELKSMGEISEMRASASKMADSATRKDAEREASPANECQSELVEALEIATDVLERLRRGHGVEIGKMCYPALNYCRDALAKHKAKAGMK